MHDRINKLIFMKPNPILHRNPENFKGSSVAERRYVYSSTDHPYLLSPVGTACTHQGALPIGASMGVNLGIFFRYFVGVLIDMPPLRGSIL